MSYIRGRTTFLLCSALAAMLVAPSIASAQQPPDGDTTVTTAHVYVHDQAGEPWASETNDDAMTQVFGENWEEEYFQTVNTSTDVGGLFAPSVRFIYLDGSDDGADELEAFLTANEAALKAFTDRGGRLFLNSAPNEGDGMSYDGRQIVFDGATTFSGVVSAADPSHPIFNGPFTPVTTSYTGGYFGHALIQGPGLTSLILGHENNDANLPADPNRVVLAEYRSCTGMTLIGGMTTVNFHDPVEEAANLRANIIHYAVNAAVDTCAPTSASSGCVSATEVSVTVTDQPGGSGPASVRYTLDGGAEQTVATDASGNARIGVPAGEHTVVFRGVDGAGNVEANPNSVTVTCQALPAQEPPADETRPRAGIRGVREACVSRAFRIRVTARDNRALRRIGVRLDGRRLVGRRLRGVRRTSFTVRINAGPLRSGGHRVVLAVRDTSGNRRTVSARFVRCARPTRRVSPNLTG